MPLIKTRASGAGEEELSSLAEVGHVSTSEGLVVSSSKPSEGFGGFVLKTIGAVFGGLSSKPSDAGLRVWALKPGRRFRCGTDGTWRHRGVRVEAKLPVRRRGGRRMKKEKVGRIYIWSVFGLCASCKGVFVF